MHIGEIMRLAAQSFRWDTKNYPSMRGELPSFQRKHSLLHLMKGLGRLADAEESADHGHPATAENRGQIAEIVAKLVTTALHFAATQGVDAFAVEAAILKHHKLPPLRVIHCEKWSGACGGPIDCWITSDRQGVHNYCSYHASIGTTLMRSEGRPVSLEHWKVACLELPTDFE